MCTMTDEGISLRDLRDRLGLVVRGVAHTGREQIVTDNGRAVAVIISLDDYERLHEHADVADSVRLGRERRDFTPLTMAEMFAELGVAVEDFAPRQAAA